jgi:hypothetical protein
MFFSSSLPAIAFFLGQITKPRDHTLTPTKCPLRGLSALQTCRSARAFQDKGLGSTKCIPERRSRCTETGAKQCIDPVCVMHRIELLFCSTWGFWEQMAQAGGGEARRGRTATSDIVYSPFRKLDILVAWQGDASLMQLPAAVCEGCHGMRAR